MFIHKEGYNIILISFLILASIVAATYIFCPVRSIFHYIFYLLILIFFILIVCFFRVPDRKIILDENSVISSADGKVVVIEKVFEPEYFKDERIQVSVFMSPLNVHQNKYPVSGIVKYFKYHPGKYLVAFNPKSSTLNERTTIVVESDKNQVVLIRQIAGALARRIVCKVKEGDKAVQGEELGFIKFGSRVDLFLPLDVDVKVKLNQKVKGGKTVIARFR
ncbi:MAG: phosphatidylserine decarboxylase family protein [Saprospiraceae bacterium]|nr:phosphatidylserine decarboxylase family protein [Saprospiraceae bacterium]